MFELPPCRIFDHRNLPQIFKLRLKLTRDNVLNLRVVGERIELMGKELEKATDIKANPEEKVQEEAKAAQASQPVEPVFQQPVYQPGYQPGFVPAPQFTMQSNTQPSKSKKARGKAAKVIALALCCSLVGGAVGAGTVICLNAYGIGVGPGYKIARMVSGGTGGRMRDNDNQERSARSDDDRDSFRNRGGNNGSQRKGTGRDSQNFGNDQNRKWNQDQGQDKRNGGRNDFGRSRQSQGESNIKGKDQGANTPDKGSDPAGQTTPETQQTKPSAGGEAKT
jgi:hypothetical protein